MGGEDSIIDTIWQKYEALKESHIDHSTLQFLSKIISPKALSQVQIQQIKDDLERIEVCKIN